LKNKEMFLEFCHASSKQLLCFISNEKKKKRKKKEKKKEKDVSFFSGLSMKHVFLGQARDPKIQRQKKVVMLYGVQKVLL